MLLLLVVLSNCPILCKEGRIVSFVGAAVAAVATIAAKLGISVMGWSVVMSNGVDVRFCGIVGAAAVVNVIDVEAEEEAIVDSVDGSVDGVDAFSLVG